MDLTKEEIEECARARARARHLEFVKHTWSAKEPFIVGHHTKIISSRIDKAINDFKKNISTFLIILCCFRHGKSELTSRTLVPHFLGEFPDREVLVTSHSNEMLYTFSRDAHRIMSSQKYAELYPNVKLSKERDAVREWCLSGSKGKAQYISLLSGTSGVGANLAIVDDYLGSPEQAQSETIRETIWVNFIAGIFSRLMHPCICLICVTPWHVDDLVGRIYSGMLNDPSFPQFETLRFPAFDKSYPSGVCFPEKYPLEWYENQKAIKIYKDGNGSYEATMQCNPIIAGGNMFKVDNIKYYTHIDEVYSDDNMV